MAKRPYFKQVVHTWMYFTMELPDILKSVQRVGLDGIDLGFRLTNLDKLNAMDLKGMCADMGLGVHCGSLGYSADCDFSSPEAKAREAAIDYTKRCVDTAVHVGCDRILVSPSALFWAGAVKFYTSREEDWKRAVESMREPAEYAKKAGVYLMIEPVNHFMMNMVHRVDQCVQMAKEIGVESMTVVPDTFHMNFEEDEGFARPLYKAGKYVKTLHVGDNSRRGPGHGTIEWRPIIGALYDIGFDGPLSHEPVYTDFEMDGILKDESAFARFESELREGAAYLKMIMDDVR